jgi:GntR family transcriptional repressor for pyruvate dehydrogenase complex
MLVVNCSEHWNTGQLFMPQIARTSLPDQVFRRLVAGVLGGRYEPGERLPTQRALAAELGVNLASVREGVKRLEQLRLLETRQGDGMRVRDWRAQGGLDVLVHAVAHGGALDAALVREVFEARRLLLAEASALAAGRRSGEQAALLERLAADLAGCADDATAQRLDLAFMATVIESARNLAFSLIANSIRDVYLERLELFRPIVERRDELGYGAVAAAIAGADGARARAAMTALASAQEQRLLEALE